MKTILNIGTSILKLILGIINILLLLIILVNIIELLATRVLKGDYPTLLDYTYYIVEKNDSTLNLNEGDLLIIDLKKIAVNDSLFMYKDTASYEIGKVKEENGKITLKNATSEKNVAGEALVGKVIKQIPKFGAVLNSILAPIPFVISVVILVITSYLQSLLNKKTKNDNTKPNFNQTW